MLHLILFEHEHAVLGHTISERLFEKAPAEYNTFALACAQVHEHSMELRNSRLYGHNASIAEGLFALIGDGTCVITMNGFAVACSSASAANIRSLLSTTLSGNDADSILVYLYTKDSKNAAISQYRALKLNVDQGLTQEEPVATTAGNGSTKVFRHGGADQVTKKYLNEASTAFKVEYLLSPVTQVAEVIDIPKKNIPEDILDNILSKAKKISGAGSGSSALVGRSISNLCEKLMCNVRLDPEVKQLSYFESVVDLINYMYPSTAQIVSSKIVAEKAVAAIKACLSFDCSYQNNTDGHQTYTLLHCTENKQLEQYTNSSWNGRGIANKGTAKIYLYGDADKGYSLCIKDETLASEVALKELAAAEVVINESLKLLQNPDTAINFIAQGILGENTGATRCPIDCNDFLQYKISVNPAGFVTEDPVNLKTTVTKEQRNEIDLLFHHLSEFILRRETAFCSKIYSAATRCGDGFTGGLSAQIFTQIYAMIYPVVTAVLNRLYYSILASVASRVAVKKYTQRIGLNHSIIKGGPALFYISKGESEGFVINSDIFCQSGLSGKFSTKTLLELARKITSDMQKYVFTNAGVVSKLEIPKTTKKLMVIFDIPLKQYTLGRYTPGAMSPKDTQLIDIYRNDSMNALFASGTYIITNSLEDALYNPTKDRYGRMSAKQGYKYYSSNDLKSSTYGPVMSPVTVNSEDMELNSLVSAYNCYEHKIGIFAEGTVMSQAGNAVYDAAGAPFSLVRKGGAVMPDTELFAVRFIRESSLPSLTYGAASLGMRVDSISLRQRNCGNNTAMMPSMIEDSEFRGLLRANKNASLALCRSNIRYRRSSFWTYIDCSTVKSALSGDLQDAANKNLEARWNDLAFLEAARNEDAINAFPECEILAYTQDKTKYISLATPLLFKQTTTTLALVTRAIGLMVDAKFFNKETKATTEKVEACVQAPAYVQSEYTKIFKASKLEKFNRQRIDTLKRLRKMREDYAAMFRKEMSSLRKENRTISSIKNGGDLLLPEEEALNKLFAQGAIEGYRMYSGKLVIKTPEMNIYEGPMIYKIGKFAISIDGLTGTHLNIKFYNLTNQKRFPRNGVYQNTSHDHPHIRNGVGCLGNLETLLSQALENRDVLSIVSLCKSYLNTVNVDDGWGRTIFSTWQKVYPTVHNIIAFGVTDNIAPNKYILLNKTVASPVYKMVKEITHAEIVAELGETLKCPISNVAELTANSSSPVWDKYRLYSGYPDYIKENKEDTTVSSGKSELEIRRNITAFMQLTSSEEFWNKHCRGQKSTKPTKIQQDLMDAIDRL